MKDELIPKIFAVYLPQFHETEDNNLWWGKGFTDWEAVRNAESFFEGHSAPWIPLNNNYYDLSKVESLKWQVDLAHKYGVDGFCFYHYYFKDGKMELETPAELLLSHPEIDISFCFNWASASWVRTWSKISGNIWSEKYDVKDLNNKSGVLVEQDYGDKSDWVEHFNYLLPFFMDKRYYKIEGRPVFIFYIPKDILCIKEMVDTWNELAREEGLRGLYTIGVNANGSYYNLDASLIYEPRNAINLLNKNEKAFSLGGVRCFDYQDIWDAILCSVEYPKVRTFFSGITGYDDTPRRGRGGECIINSSADLFEKNLVKLLKKSAELCNDFLLLNAWNEWGEGMFLEPDEANGYRYLEAIRKAKDTLKEQNINIKINEMDIKYSDDEEKKQLLLDVNKYKYYTEFYDKWLYLERKNKSAISEYFCKEGAFSIAIYGMGLLGKQLYESLYKSEIKVLYGVDRYVSKYDGNLEIIRPENAIWPAADAIVLTVYDEDSYIYKYISKKTNNRIITIDNLINDLWKGNVK